MNKVQQKALKKSPKNVDFTTILLAASYAVITRQHTQDSSIQAKIPS